MTNDEVKELAKAMYDRGVNLGQLLVYKWELAPEGLRRLYIEEAGLILQEVIKLGYKK